MATWPRHLALAVIELAVRDLEEPKHCGRVAEKVRHKESAKRFFRDEGLAGWCGIAQIRIEKVRRLYDN